MDKFRIVREVPIVDVAQYYGMSLERKGKNWWTSCIDHADKTPSLRLNTNTNRFCCYSCGFNGSSIDLVSKMFNLNMMDSIKRIDSDFRLGLSLEVVDKQAENKRLKEMRKRKQEQEELNEWKNQTYTTLCLYHRVVFWSLKGMNCNHRLYKQTIENQAYLEYLLDCIQFASEEELKQAREQFGNKYISG
jgi:hypothetical protein